MLPVITFPRGIPHGAFQLALRHSTSPPGGDLPGGSAYVLLVREARHFVILA
jgi:hypothetical protein